MPADALSVLADALLRSCPPSMFGATIVGATFDDGPEPDVELAVKHVDGHPLEELDGFVAPQSWSALGVMCGAWAAPMEGIRPSAHPDAKRVQQVVLVDRKGRIEARVRYPDGSVLREPPGSGVVLEALFACLGLEFVT